MFAFLLSLSDVNVYLAMWHFVWDDATTPTYLDFQRALAWELIDNPSQQPEKERIENNFWRLRKTHKLVVAPKHANCWDRQGWKKEAKLPCKQFIFKDADGKNSLRGATRFACTAPVIWICGCARAVTLHTC